MPNRKESPKQLTVNKFKPLLSLDSIDIGTHIHKPNDLKEVHWEYTTYTIIGSCKKALLCKDTNGNNHAFAWEDLPSLNFQVIVG